MITRDLDDLDLFTMDAEESAEQSQSSESSYDPDDVLIAVPELSNSLPNSSKSGTSNNDESIIQLVPQLAESNPNSSAEDDDVDLALTREIILPTREIQADIPQQLMIKPLNQSAPNSDDDDDDAVYKLYLIQCQIAQ